MEKLKAAEKILKILEKFSDEDKKKILAMVEDN